MAAELDETGSWLRIDEIGQMIDAVEHSAELASTLSDNVMRWKWLIIALHSALQGACTCALRGQHVRTDSVLRKDKAAAFVQWLEDSRETADEPAPDLRLADMIELYGRSRSRGACPNHIGLWPTNKRTRMWAS
jgi:hypothetical protein